MQEERERLLKQIAQLSEVISVLPEGNLVYSRSDNRTKWLISNGSSRTYVSLKKRQFIEELALRKYDSFIIEENRRKVQLIDSFIAKYEKCQDKALQMLSENSCYKELLQDLVTTPSERMKQWARADYPKSSKNPEHLIHKCIANHYVRSKSEVIIANALLLNKIPYRYECQLLLGENEFYPDFTICHPRTETIIYWEHFGLMDHRQYRKKVADKIVTYGDYDIYPSMNLITTYETAACPINSEKVERVIREYFL